VHVVTFQSGAPPSLFQFLCVTARNANAVREARSEWRHSLLVPR